MSAESFTVLAILAARDQASEIFTKIDESLDKFSDTAQRAAQVAKASGEAIDESLTQTASGADALDVAEARVAASSERVVRARQAEADAERELLEARQAAVASAGEDAAAEDRLLEANRALSKAETETAAAAKAESDALKLQADTATAVAAKNDIAAGSQKAVSDSAVEGGLNLGKLGKIAGITALGLGVAGAVMVKAAGNFQDSTVHLVTDAGESAKNLGMVQAGILNVSTATGQSAADITNAMYHIESGGYHASTGLAILKAVAEGARVGGADLDTTSKALVGTLTAYYGTSMTAAQATQRSTSLMNQLVATVGSGDMRLQDLASSLSAVTPVAAAAHVSFAQVGGAIATMTAQGMSARQASQDLANMLRNVLKPSAVASQEMRALGLNANQVSNNLGKAGLTGTLQTYTDAILKNSQGGNVLLGYMKEMSPAAQGLARSILAGTIGTKDLRTAVYGLNPQQAKLISLFESAATSATGLKQTYTGAMATLTGGATGLNVALMLSGKHMSDFTKNVNTIAGAAKKGGSQVSGWSTIQSTFNFKVAQAKTALENTGIAIGTALLPAVTSLLTAVTHIVVPVAEWAAHNKTLVLVLFAGVAAIAATIAIIAGLKKAYTAVSTAVGGVKKALQAVGLMAKQTATTQEAAATEAASVQESEAAGAADAQEAAAEESAAASEAAADETSSSWIVSAARTVGAWVAAGARMAGQAAVWVAQNAVKVAVVVGEQLAAAATTAAAWVVANAAMIAGIGLVVLAVAAAVYEIVTHWSQIVAGVRKAWDAVYDFISHTISDTIAFVRSHWELIVSIIGGPLAAAAVLVFTHIDDIKRWFSDGVHDVESVLSWFGRLPGLFSGWLSSASSAVWSAGARALNWFSSLPGKVASWLSGLPGQMLSVGENIVKGIWNGLSSMGGWLWSKISGFASGILGDIGHAFGIGSPSKYTTVHGQMLGAGLGNGLIASLPKILAAVRTVSSKVLAATSSQFGGGGSSIESSLAASAIGGAGGAAGTGGGITIVVDVHGNTVMSASQLDELVDKIGKRVAAQILPAAGRKVTIRG